MHKLGLEVGLVVLASMPVVTRVRPIFALGLAFVPICTVRTTPTHQCRNLQNRNVAAVMGNTTERLDVKICGILNFGHFKKLN